jgi:hypothetical protein
MIKKYLKDYLFFTMKKMPVIIFLLALNCTCLFAQDAVTGGILQQFNDYRVKALQEKLYVHTDKSFYLAGEVCWFKIYATDASFNKPLGLSKIAYAELVSTEHKPILQAKINLEDASGSGSFLLPFSITSGSYTLRAYTSWMKNFSPDYYFEKQITIVNTLKKPVWNPNDTLTSYDAQFFPEGGNLVNGIQGVVAFKVNDHFGKGVDSRGTIVNQRNDTIAIFKSLRYGMGQFNFTPVKGDTYKAIIITSDNKTIAASLPRVYDQGYILHLSTTADNKIKVTVTTNAPDKKPVYLFIQTRHSVKAALTTAINNQTASFIVDKNVLGEGISHFTLFNGDRQPVCERIYFKRPQQQLAINISTDHALYEKRKKIELSLQTNNLINQPVAADLSMAVVLLDSLQRPESTNVLSYLWLESDLKGIIEEPAYYFTDSSEEANKAADNLMLTQGWRRFEWNNILTDKKPAFEFLPEYDGHILNGIITDKMTGLPAKNISTYISVAGKPFRFNSAVSNADGRIQFDMEHFYATSEIIVQPNNRADTNYRIEISNPFSDKFSTRADSRFSLIPGWQNALTQRSIGAQAQHVYTSNKLQRFYTTDINDTTAFYGKNFKTYLLDDYTRFITMEEVLREYVKEVRLRKNHDQYYMEIKNTNETDFTGKPLVLVDGIPVYDANKIIALDPLKVKKIDVVAHKYFFGSLIIDGVVSCTSYEGDLAGMSLDPAALIIEYPGLQLQREFYSPSYETAEQFASRLPDFRNVLYWDPYAGTGLNGKRAINFYTGDLPGRYAVIVQGITTQGLAGSAVIQLTVK